MDNRASSGRLRRGLRLLKYPYGATVVCDGIVDGGTVVLGIVATVLGTNVEDVGGGSVVVVGGGSVVAVVAVVVATGGAVVTGALVPMFRGAVVATGGWVLPVAPGGMVATVVVLESTVEEDAGTFDVVVALDVVEVGTVVDEDDWVATCSLGDESVPVATSKTMAPRAMAART